MCGRYYIPDEDSAAELREIIEQIQNQQDAERVKTGEIFPGDRVPVLANNKKQIITPFAMKWGYQLSNGTLVFNTRSETAQTKPLFKESMALRRCLVPAAHYFEWEKKGKEKIKYAIAPKETSPMYMAGIYRIENGRPVFSILTRAPAECISFIHDRMPVILPKEAKEDWLNLHYKAEEVLNAAVQELRFAPC